MKAKRDYNKEPLVLKDYESFMKWHYCVMFVVILSSTFPFVIVTKDGFSDIAVSILVLLFCFLFDALFYYLFIVKGNRKVKLYNSKIRRYKNGKLIDEHKFVKGEFSSELKKVSIENLINFKDMKFTYLLLVMACLAYSVFKSYISGILMMIACVLWFIIFTSYDRFVKQIIYKKTNGSLYNFTTYLGQ